MPPSVSPVLAGLVDEVFDGRVAIGVEAVDFARVPHGSQRFECAFDRLDRFAAELDDVAKRRDAKARQELLGERPGGDADGRLPRAGPLQDRADAGQVLDRAGQVAVPGPRAGEVVQPFELVVAVLDLQGDRAAERRAVPDAAEDVDRVGLDPLPTAASIPPCRRRSSTLIGSGSIATPAGKPSTSAISVFPCDSPAVQ
jgi:hypothetical protein